MSWIHTRLNIGIKGGLLLLRAAQDQGKPRHGKRVAYLPVIVLLNGIGIDVAFQRYELVVVDGAGDTVAGVACCAGNMAENSSALANARRGSGRKVAMVVATFLRRDLPI